MSRAREETVLPPKDAEILGAIEHLLSSGNEPLRLMAADGSDAFVLPEELRHRQGSARRS